MAELMKEVPNSNTNLLVKHNEYIKYTYLNILFPWY